MRYTIEVLSGTYSRDFCFESARVHAERYGRPIRITALEVRIGELPAERVQELEKLLGALAEGEGIAAAILADLVDGPEFWKPVAYFDVQPDGTVTESKA